MFNKVLTYKSNNPYLHVRAFIWHTLTGIKTTLPIDKISNNSWTASNIQVTRIDGGKFNHLEPLLLPLQTELTAEFRANSYYMYANELANLKEGNYSYLLEVRSNDTVNPDKTKTIGSLFETVNGEFEIIGNPLDRTMLVGYDQYNKPLNLSINEILSSLYKTQVNYSVSGTGTSDLIINLPNINDGNVIILTYKEGEVKLIGKQYKLIVAGNKVVLSNANYGKYIATLSNGDTQIIYHKIGELSENNCN